MERLAARYDPAEVEAATRAFWGERTRRRDTDGSTRRAGRPVRLFLGAVSPQDSLASTLYRGVVADAESRYLRLSGRRSETSLRVRVPWVGDGQEATIARLERAAVGVPAPEAEGTAERRRWMLGRLADARILVARKLPLRRGRGCAAPPTPQAIIYESGSGPAYLVRFRLPEEAEPTSLLVWTDEAWKLLGTVAVLVNPETQYVLARWTRRGVTERIIVSRNGLARLLDWLGGSEAEVLEEKLGADLAGAVYVHPLALEFPPLADLLPPAGTIVGSNDVSDTGSGIVTLVPAHGAGDAAVGRAHRIEGPAVVGPDGVVLTERAHKYAGLELSHAEAFILRDLSEGGTLFAELSVRRGVPHCGVCGAALRWVPGRAWCLEPGRLSGESLAAFSRLLPLEPIPLTSEIVPWAVSEANESLAAADALLSECTECERLSTAATGERCACGGGFVAVRRRLLPSFQEAIDGWASARDLETVDAVRLYLAERRRSPALLHHLCAREALDRPPADLRVITLPTLPSGDLPDGPGEDAVRAALLRSPTPPRGADAVRDRAVQERRRLAKLWGLAARILDRSITDGFEPDSALAAHLPELAEEDRAFLSTFERLRLDVRRHYDSGDLAGAQALLALFAEADLRTEYLRLVEPRLALPGLPPEKVAVYRVLHHVVPLWVELYAPIAPFAMEAIHRAFRGDGGSVFDRTIAPSLERVLSPDAEGDYGRWRSVEAALAHGRREFGVPAGTELPRAVLLVQDEAVAGRLRATSTVLGRLARVTELLVASPDHPWDGQRVEARPVLPAIQKTYGAQSARVVRLLEQIPTRRIQDGIRAGTLSIALDGRTMPILPGMVEFAESLPDDVLPLPWGEGEILITLPADPSRHRRRAPALSLDGYRLVRHLERRLRRAGGVRPELVVVSADGPLAEQVSTHATAVAEYLGVGQVSVNDGTIQLPPSETTVGRTRRGDRWRVYVPGLPVPTTVPKPPRAPRGTRRVRDLAPARPEPEALEYLDQAMLDREATLRAIVESVDRVVGRPIVGPAKVGVAFDAGFDSFEAFSHAPYAKLSGLVGYGPILAAELVGAFGGDVPPPAPHHRPRINRPGDPLPEELAPPPMTPSSPMPEIPAPAVATAGIPTLSAPPVPGPLAPPAPPPPVPVSAPIVAPVPGAIAPAPTQTQAVAPVPTAPPQLAMPVPVVPEMPPPPPAPPSGVRLSLGDREEPAWRKFLDATSAGHRGLCLSREFPERRRALLGPRDVEVVWLSNVGKGTSVRPADLAALTTLLTTALTDRGVTAIFVEGGEYLVRIHGAGPIADLLRTLNAEAEARGARIWLPINPALMPTGDVETLTAAVPADTPSPD
jgi:hypothetical protein